MKLAHRGIRVWISSDGIEQNIWVWRMNGKVIPKWDKRLNADTVAGHIAVEEGQVRVVVSPGPMPLAVETDDVHLQRLRVNVESDGSMGAIAVDLLIDGYQVTGPYLKGEGTAWIEGVSAPPKGRFMAGRFQIVKISDDGACVWFECVLTRV